MILSLYGKIQVRENPYSGIFYTVVGQTQCSNFFSALRLKTVLTFPFLHRLIPLPLILELLIAV